MEKLAKFQGKATDDFCHYNEYFMQMFY